MKILRPVKAFALSSVMVSMPLFSITALSQSVKNDNFEYSVPASGTTDYSVLKKAPKNSVRIAGKQHNAAIVVDLSQNILYHYDSFGNAQKAYKIASGKKESPTNTGIRIVTHIESYPYKNASRATKRRKNPTAYGPKVICLNKVDVNTGEQSQTGEFIHGNNDPSSIGKYASGGCMRMDNEVIKELSQQVKKGDIVIIKK